MPIAIRMSPALAIPGNGDSDLWHYVALRVPLLVSRFLPFSVLLGTLIAFVGLNQHSEETERSLMAVDANKLKRAGKGAPPPPAATNNNLEKPQSGKTVPLQLQLDPDYEPWDKAKRIEYGGSAEGNAQKAADFIVLLHCRDNGLVEPLDEPSLYYVAMNQKRCRLTPTGRYIWRLAKDNRI